MADEKKSPTLTIPDDIITPIVTAQINTLLAEAMCSKEVLIKRAIQTILDTKVSANGTVSNYSSENKYSWLEAQVRNLLSEKIRGIIKDAIDTRTDQLRSAVIKELSSHKSKLVASLADAFVEKVKNTNFDYRMKIDINGD